MPASETIKTIMERRSIRRYTGAPVADEDLRTILEAARRAPSSANRQPWHFVVVQDPARKQQVATACARQLWLTRAAAIIVVVGLPEQSRWYNIDASLALQTLILAAASLGYGTCCIGAFNEATIKQALEIPEEGRILTLVALGVPAEHPPVRFRKSFDQLFSLDRYGEKVSAGQ